jgi:hypothetical protein
MDEQYQKYERCFIATVFEHAAKKYKTHIQFARELWPGKTDGNISTRIRAIREQNSRGKPQGLKIRDAAKMADILDITMSSLTLEVETKLRLGWSEVEGGGQLALFCCTRKNEEPEEKGVDTERLPLSDVHGTRIET